MKREQDGTLPEVRHPGLSRNPELRLLVIPLAIYAAWALDTFLLEGRVNLFSHADPFGLLLFTIVSCILIGTIVPILWIRVSFLSGVVNMFQIGFRSLRRTLAACAGTILAGYLFVLIFSPFGPDRIAFFNTFLLLLPAAVASVMICWVLLGTHVQAYVRASGALVSIHVGVVVTTITFGLTAVVYAQTGPVSDALFWFACVGVISSLFFFAVRDIYATSIAVAGLLVFIMHDRIDPAYFPGLTSWVYLSAGLAVGALVGVHWYFSRHYTTILVPHLKE